jgi:hypothetical protein
MKMTNKQAFQGRNNTLLIIAFAVMMVLMDVAAIAQTPAQTTQEKWVAGSTSAMGITGDISISPDKLIIKGKDYPLVLVRDIDAQQLSDAGKIVNAMKPPTWARLYKTKFPVGPKLGKGYYTSVCGPKDANWLLTVYGNSPYGNEPQLSLAFFSGDNEPNLNYEVVSKSTELCGVLMYSH